MSRPRLFFGHKTGGQVMEVGEGYTDLDAPYVPLVVSDPQPTDGLEGETLFTAVYLALEHRAPPEGDDLYEEAVVRLVPIVDMVEYPAIDIVVRMQPRNEGRPPKRVTRSYEVGLSRSITDAAGMEQGRVALRGVFFQLKVELPATEIHLLRASLETESLLESQTPVNV